MSAVIQLRETYFTWRTEQGVTEPWLQEPGINTGLLTHLPVLAANGGTASLPVKGNTTESATAWFRPSQRTNSTGTKDLPTHMPHGERKDKETRKGREAFWACQTGKTALSQVIPSQQARFGGSQWQRISLGSCCTMGALGLCATVCCAPSRVNAFSASNCSPDSSAVSTAAPR